MKKDEYIRKITKDQNRYKLYNWFNNSLVFGFCIYVIYKANFTNWLNIPIQTTEGESYLYQGIFILLATYCLVQISRSRLLTKIESIPNEFNELTNKGVIESVIAKLDFKILSNNGNYYLCLKQSNWWSTRKEIHLLAHKNEINFFTNEPGLPSNPAPHISARKLIEFNEILGLKIKAEINTRKQSLRKIEGFQNNSQSSFDICN